jgi:hypothetical protein
MDFLSRFVRFRKRPTVRCVIPREVSTRGGEMRHFFGLTIVAVLAATYVTDCTVVTLD